MARRSPLSLFLFPEINSTVLPDPSNLFDPNLLSSPLPTNSFFQNFALKNGDQPEYVHPYLVKSSSSSVSVSYPSRFFNSTFGYQIFVADLTISASQKTDQVSHKSHIISDYGDLSVTLDIPCSKLRFFLIRGSPFLTAAMASRTELSITTIHAILSLSSNHALTKHSVNLNNGQTWLIYTSSPIKLDHSLSEISSGRSTHKADKMMWKVHTMSFDLLKLVRKFGVLNENKRILCGRSTHRTDKMTCIWRSI